MSLLHPSIQAVRANRILLLLELSHLSDKLLVLPCRVGSVRTGHSKYKQSDYENDFHLRVSFPSCRSLKTQNTSTAARIASLTIAVIERIISLTFLSRYC
jgi:hypothetical protein